MRSARTAAESATVIGQAMGGKSGFRAYPLHLRRNKGKGFFESEASGFLRPIGDRMEDVRQGQVGRDEADLTPGFGSSHPQDHVSLGVLDDPKPVEDARPDDKKNLSKSDLAMSDQEITASIKEGRAPRIGF